MRAEVKLGLGVSAVICTVVGGYFLLGREKESNIPVDATPVAANTPAKPGAAKPEPTKPVAANGNRTRPTNPVKPNNTNATNPRTATNQPDAARTARPNQPTTSNPNGAAAPGTENPAVAANPQRPSWPPANPDTATGPLASRGTTDQPINPTTMPTTPLSATSSPNANPTNPNVPSSEVNQPVKTPPNERAVDPRNPNAGNPATRTPVNPPVGPINQPGNASGTVPTSPVVANPTPAGQPITTPIGAQPIAKSVEAAVETHRVQPGDSFASLAETYYGNPRLAKFLMESNKDLGDPTRLSVGMVVKIPPKPADGKPTTETAAKPESKAAPTQPTPAPTGAAKGKSKTYTVKSGDSFYSIAKSQLGNSARWKQLYALNKKLVDEDPTRLRPGQVLTLPVEEPSKTTP